MISSNEYFRVAQHLRFHYDLFYACWKIGKPKFTDKIPTAAVGFSRTTGQYIEYLFNRGFYNSLDDYQRAFVVAHEALHVILNHGKRLKGKHPYIGNIAADVVINELLLTRYGFDKDKLDSNETLKAMFTFDVLEPVIGKVDRNQSFEFYYDLLMDKAEKVAATGGQSFDSHDMLEDASIDNILEHIEKTSKGSGFSRDQKEFLEKLKAEFEDKHEENKRAGNTVSRIDDILNAAYRPTNIWRKLTRDVRSANRLRNREKEEWYWPNYKLQAMKTSLGLPGHRDRPIVKKLPITVFMDVSGSCVHLKDDFFALLRSIPSDTFNVEAFVFDDEVRRLDLDNPKIEMGGGTCFAAIANYISKMPVYPTNIFIVTDGHGTAFETRYPERWTWVLSENMTSYIPKQSKICKLEDFSVKSSRKALTV